MEKDYGELRVKLGKTKVMKCEERFGSTENSGKVTVCVNRSDDELCGPPDIVWSMTLDRCQVTLPSRPAHLLYSAPSPVPLSR